jgi:hypothetical protein
MVIWSIFHRFGVLHLEKSGNPVDADGSKLKKQNCPTKPSRMQKPIRLFADFRAIFPQEFIP